MTKKLKLSDFLAFQKPETIKIPENPTEFTYSLEEFKEAIENHQGSFLVDSRAYPVAISSDYSLYFYKGERTPFLIMYEPVIDIKRRNNTLLVFSDQDTISITLL